MKHWIASATLASIATFVQAQDATSPFSRPDVTWHLSEFNGAPFDKPSGLTFSEPDRVAGLALCNRFTGTAEWSPGSLEFGPLAVTRMACPDMGDEPAILQALASVTQGSIVADNLILTLRDGSRMVYRADDAAP